MWILVAFKLCILSPDAPAGAEATCAVYSPAPGYDTSEMVFESVVECGMYARELSIKKLEEYGMEGALYSGEAECLDISEKQATDPKARGILM